MRGVPRVRRGLGLGVGAYHARRAGEAVGTLPGPPVAGVAGPAAGHEALSGKQVAR